jgi:glyoxylase-like metal-dependent hydrolase (beta-lactamase superfamily II)
MVARLDLIVTHGVFSIDGEDFEVDNNIWLVGDGDEVLVIDAAHDHRPIVDAVGSRRLVCLCCTHGHNDHINAAGGLADACNAPVLLHPADTMLWDVVYPERRADGALGDGAVLHVAGTELHVVHTPGHSPGGCCLYWPERDIVFSGDTLFRGGPGATGRSFSDYDTIVRSIRTKLFRLPERTEVHTGHGDSTTIGDEIRTIGS